MNQLQRQHVCRQQGHPHHPVASCALESCMLLMLPLLDAIIPEASNSQQPRGRHMSSLSLLTFLVLSMPCPCLVHVFFRFIPTIPYLPFHAIGCQWQDVGSHVIHVAIIQMLHQEITRD